MVPGFAIVFATYVVSNRTLFQLWRGVTLHGDFISVCGLLLSDSCFVESIEQTAETRS
jgi:hypothetical protein